MGKFKSGIERNKLDFILTDIMPVEVSELFSYGKFYEYLLSHQKELNEIIKQMHLMKAQNSGIPFMGEWGSWASIPLKYEILKGTQATREINLVQPLAAMEMYFFIECYQKEILDTLSENSCFSLRYHRKNTDLYYKRRINRTAHYFEHTSKKLDRAVLQQTGAYFKIHKFNSVASFTNSRLWRQCNFKYKHFAKADYKSCFNSIYTHAFKWCIERNTIDSKAAKNSNLYIVIDRLLQNINARSSNGVIVGPEFSRMIAEILLQHIDIQVKEELSQCGLIAGEDYRIFRYVDDIYIFANIPENIDAIINTIQQISHKYLLSLNELKCIKSETPVIISDWLGKTRNLADRIADLFFSRHELHQKEEPTPLLKGGYIPLDRIKDEFTCLIHDYPNEKRYIVSFILSTLLNNISNKKDGYQLFEQKKCGRAYILLDMAMHVYSFCPCFEHTQKLISMFVYFDDEVNFVHEEINHRKLINLFTRYAFIFERGNINDLCNWLIFFYEYKIALPQKTELVIEEHLEKEDNPILWANYLIYSRYYLNYHKKILSRVESVIDTKLESITEKEMFLQREFWYVLVFANCPYLNPAIIARITQIIQNGIILSPQTVSQKACNLIYDFMSTNKQNLFFCWGYYKFNTSKQLTFRTYQRTLFKQYKNKNSIELYGSLDS